MINPCHLNLYNKSIELIKYIFRLMMIDCSVFRLNYMAVCKAKWHFEYDKSRFPRVTWS